MQSSLLTCFLVLNNNPVLNGWIKFSCIYSLTSHPTVYAVRVKNGLVQATLFSMVILQWVSPKIEEG